MKFGGNCWNMYKYTNVVHRSLIIELNINSDRLFFDLCMLPNALSPSSSQHEWKSFINHVVKVYPDGKAHWGGNWNMGENLYTQLMAMKGLKMIPMICFGHCEERPNSFLTRNPSHDQYRLSFIARFIKEMADYMVNIMGIPYSIFEVWNEANECQSPEDYANVCISFIHGLNNTPYDLAIGGCNYREKEWLHSAINYLGDNYNNVKYVTTHYLTDDEWNSGVPTVLFGKPHIISEGNFLYNKDRAVKVKPIEGYYSLLLAKPDGIYPEFDSAFVWNLNNPDKIIKTDMFNTYQDLYNTLMKYNYGGEIVDMKLTNLKVGSSGGQVRWVQEILMLEYGFENNYPNPFDGKYGNATKQQIINYQKANGLVADGAVGVETTLNLLFGVDMKPETDRKFSTDYWYKRLVILTAFD